jgi:hypothetical protein
MLSIKLYKNILWPVSHVYENWRHTPRDITLKVFDNSVVTRISAQYGEITRIGRDLRNNGKTLWDKYRSISGRVHIG